MENSKIEWCHHTVNLWWGCYEVNKACDNCYAKTLANRYHGPDLLWEQQGPRMYIKSAMNDLIKYQARAAKEGVVYRIFINSMSDLFEKSMPVVDHKHQPMFFEDGPTGTVFALETEALRHNFFALVRKCPNLFFILLTKRPSNIIKYVPSSWITFPPANVIYMTSCPDQESFNTLVPQLLKVPGKHGLSLEPLIEPIDMSDIGMPHHALGNGFHNPLTGANDLYEAYLPEWKLNWVICGGESGQTNDIRPMNSAWAEGIQKQCEAAGVPFFFKQWGEWLPLKAGEFIEYAADGSNRTFYYEQSQNSHTFRRSNDQMFYKVGKHNAGALLAGKEYKEFPSCT